MNPDRVLAALGEPAPSTGVAEAETDDETTQPETPVATLAPR